MLFSLHFYVCGSGTFAFTLRFTTRIKENAKETPSAMTNRKIKPNGSDENPRILRTNRNIAGSKSMLINPTEDRFRNIIFHLTTPILSFFGFLNQKQKPIPKDR